MIRRRLLLTAAAAATLATGLAACGDKAKDAPAAATPQAKLSPKDSYEMASKGHGFSTGAVMAANTVYVFFDPACPHCAVLWANSQPLQNRLKFVWMPVALLGMGSLAQGATILHAADPVKAMAENEASVKVKGGGITASQGLTDAQLGKVQANTDLFMKMGAESVPFIVYKNGRTGEFGSLAGSVPTDQLAAMAGV